MMLGRYKTSAQCVRSVFFICSIFRREKEDTPNDWGIRCGGGDVLVLTSLEAL